jgi:hypothetical protein
MNRLKGTVWISGIAIMLSLPASAATVYGYVADSDGRAVRLDKVEVLGGGGCSVNGARFDCRLVDPGTLTLQITPTDGNTTTIKVYAGAGETRHNLRLPER